MMLLKAKVFALGNTPTYPMERLPRQAPPTNMDNIADAVSCGRPANLNAEANSRGTC
jgi:hypothetical protein